MCYSDSFLPFFLIYCGVVMKPKSYTEENLQKALTAVRNGCSIYKASRQYKIPESTLRDKRDQKYSSNVVGKKSNLTELEETAIVDWIHYLAKQGFPVSKKLLAKGAANLADNLDRPNRFKDGVPGKHWIQNFLVKYPGAAKVVTQKPEITQTEQDVRAWFIKIRSDFEIYELIQVLEDKSRIFNCDEVAFFLNPKENDVLAKKRSRRVFFRVADDEEECLTVLVNVSAGELPPPMVLFPYKDLPKELPPVPPSWGVCCTESGWTNMNAFYEYITNVFYKWLLEKNITLPVVVFMGDNSYISVQLSLFCKEKGIILLAFPPNTNHLLHPLDVGVLKAVEEVWESIAAKFRTENNCALTRTDFATGLKKCFKKSLTKKLIKQSFNNAGIFPFDADNIDFSKPRDVNRNRRLDTQETKPESEEYSSFKDYWLHSYYGR